MKDSFNLNHPEIREGEKWLTNSTTGLSVVGWKTARLGNVAYTHTGRVINDTDIKPVFVMKSEVEPLDEAIDKLLKQ